MQSFAVFVLAVFLCLTAEKSFYFVLLQFIFIWQNIYFSIFSRNFVFDRCKVRLRNTVCIFKEKTVLSVG